jgi:DMSO/TMAO reductase YedYZ molybdopterin-dependent catalytic subunit
VPYDYKESMMTKCEPDFLAALPVHPGGPAESHSPILVVDGLVAHRLELTPADLAAFPLAEVTDDFRCLEGWSVPGLHWVGIPLTAVLEAAGVAAQARFVQASSGEFSVPLTLEDASGALLATRLGDTPLPREHGWPVRLVVPGADCFTSIKWLDRIELRAVPGVNTGRTIALGRLPA